MTSDPIVKEEVLSLVSLTAHRVQIFQPPRTWSEDFGGGRDVDCIVEGLDPTWVLRLPTPWRLCQALQYRHSRYQWWLERDRHVLIIDTTNDPPMTLESGVSSVRLLSNDGLEGSPTERAIYLTKKRLLKHMLDPEDWRLISPLAREDEATYLHGLAATYGRRCAQEIAKCGVTGVPPAAGLARRARRGRLLGYARRPTRAAAIAWAEATRIARRIARPTGLHIIVVGPDGSGKSTVAQELLRDCGRLFRRKTHVHWGPAVLPRLGGLIGRAPSDASQPHSRTPHGKLLSHLLLGYYWLDFFLGSWMRLQAVRIRTGLVILERGWWDMAVDPLRYRLTPLPRTVMLLGRLLPRPDVLVVLESDANTLHSRKPELPVDELQRQLSAWRELAPRIGNAMYEDTSRSLNNTSEELWAETVSMLEARGVPRLGAGWTGLGTRTFRRWLLPRGPHAVARAGLAIYQPVTRRGRLGWKAARGLARVGAFRLLPRSQTAPREVRELLAAHVPPFGSVAFGRANHPGRYLAVIIDREGHCRKLAKVATDEAGRRALAREAGAIEDIARLLTPPLSHPELLHVDEGILVFKHAAWRVRSRPWYLPEQVAFTLGRFFRKGGSASNGGLGASHGDFAPWNLLELHDGTWMLVDWEEASEDRGPFWDVMHYLIQGYALLGRPSERALLEGLEGHGWVATALKAYADGAGVDIGYARATLVDYLEDSKNLLDPNRSDCLRGIEARHRLLVKVGRG